MVELSLSHSALISIDLSPFRRDCERKKALPSQKEFECGGYMANPFVMRAEAITNCTEDLQRHIDAYAAYTPNNDKAQGKLALVVIADLQKKLEELQRRLKVALD